ncbi:MAG: hypothetical protein U0586_08920 [Candidatus Brocadiaceae bacterium]
MLTAETQGTSFIAAKITAKAIITGMLFILTFTHDLYMKIVKVYTNPCKN